MHPLEIYIVNERDVDGKKKESNELSVSATKSVNKHNVQITVEFS